ncbi:MAG TPA: DNA polymerase Y family protein [Porticoccaceae bacterium]|nr:DNA polymerase Y family protein [Porticoccaceae bacterium]
MLWLGVRCLDLPLAALPAGGEHARPLAVTEQQRIYACNAAARARDLANAMPIATALALCPELGTEPRDPIREGAALEALGMACYALTPQVVLHPPAALLLEVRGSLKLFRGLGRLLARLRELLELRRLSAALGAAPTPAAALLLSHAGADPLTYLDDGGLPRRPAACTELLRELPLDVLDCPAHLRADLARAGLRRLGALFDLPGKALGRRYGQELLHYLERIRGQRPDPRQPLPLPATFARELEFGAEIANTEMLLFPARRLLQELGGYLRARQMHCGSLRWTLLLDDHGRQTLPLQLAGPRGDLRHLLELTRLGFARLRLSAPVTALALHCDDLHPPSELQDDLLGALAPTTDARALQALCDRLAARLGTDAIRQPRAHDEHLPELASVLRPPSTTATAAPSPPCAPRPLWLLETPLPLGAPAGKPSLDGPLVLESGVERIEGQWWQSPASRDYHRARTLDGRRCWLYRDRRTGAWFLHGLFG